MAENLLTIQEIADYLQIDKFTVYRLIAQGNLPAYKHRGQWRITEEMLQAWLRQNLNVDSAPDCEPSPAKKFRARNPSSYRAIDMHDRLSRNIERVPAKGKTAAGEKKRRKAS